MPETEFRVTYHRNELGDEPHIVFWVGRPDKGKPPVCVVYPPDEGNMALVCKPDSFGDPNVPDDILIDRAFEVACRFAEERGISAILIKDPDRLWEQHR